MGANRILLLEGALNVSIDTGRLALLRKGEGASYVSPRDVAVLLIDSPAVTITSAAMRALAEAGASVIMTDQRHMPVAEMYPYPAPTRQVLRLRQQISVAGTEFADEIWRRLVVSRIASQAFVLRKYKRKGALYLERLAKKVRLADASNHEAQAARHYWKYLWPEPFRREKQGAEDGINSRLNYGYAVLRSLVARALVAAGFSPALGFGHNSEANPFNLADDLLEAYRFVVEAQVAAELDVGLPDEFDVEARMRMAQCIATEVVVSGQCYRLPAAIEAGVASLARSLESGGRLPLLALPEGIGA